MMNRAIAAFKWQMALGREVPSEPTTSSMEERMPDGRSLRLAHARVLLEEAFEAVEALGCCVHARGSREVLTSGSITVEDDGRRVGPPDLERIAHELTDVAYITETTAVMYGLPTDRLFAAVHQANMTRILPDGTLLRHPSRNRHEQYRAPDIRGIIEAARHSEGKQVLD